MASDPHTRVAVKARVLVTLEVDVSDCWGGDCPLAQVQRQAKESAAGILARMRGGNRENPGPLPFVIVGEMKVTAVLVEEAR